MALDHVALVGVGDTGVNTETWLRQSGLDFGLLADVEATEVSSGLRVAVVVGNAYDPALLDEVRRLEARLHLHAVVPVWVFLGKVASQVGRALEVTSLSELACTVRALYALACESNVDYGCLCCSLLDVVADTAIGGGSLEVLTIERATPDRCVTELLRQLGRRVVHRVFLLASVADRNDDAQMLLPVLAFHSDHTPLVRVHRPEAGDRGPWVTAFIQCRDIGV